MNAQDELSELDRRSELVNLVQGGLANGVAEYIADALLAAEYRKPAKLTTLAALSEAPRGIVVREPLGLVWEKQGDGEGGEFWVETGDGQEYKASDITLPVTVLYIPGVTK